MAEWKERRQAVIGRFIADFYCAQARLVIDIDGGSHAEPEQAAYDAARTAWLEAQGYRVIRFWNNEVLNNLEGSRASSAWRWAMSTDPANSLRPAGHRPNSTAPNRACPVGLCRI